jgi:hypothetical protein
MRGRTTRHGRTERNRLLNAQVSLREVAVVYATMALFTVLLWLVANPVLAVGVGALMAAVYATMQVGRRVVRSLLRARRVA